jgi:hypothetical protein
VFGCARILIPSTIYNYGQDAFPVLREDSPQTATTHKGKIRIAVLPISLILEFSRYADFPVATDPHVPNL